MVACGLTAGRTGWAPAAGSGRHARRRGRIVDFITAIVLGLVEGLTEFLPVSSTAHLVLINRWFDFGNKDFQSLFAVVIQSGAILAVIIYFWKKINPLDGSKTREQRTDVWRMWLKVLVAVIPALAVGAVFGKAIKGLLVSPAATPVIAVSLLAGGVLLIVIERARKNSGIDTVKEITFLTAFSIGLIQCLGMVPGVSRSAATIVGAMLLGLTRRNAAEFSFFLAIPTLIAAGGYSLLKSGFRMSSGEWAVLGVGFAVSFLTAWGVIAVFMDFIRKHDFKPFGVYRIALGVLILVLMVLGRI